MLKVEVYRNLHKNCWSIRDCKTKKVIKHVQSAHIKNAELVVQPAGRAKVLREQRKNVHAFVRGQLEGSWNDHIESSSSISPIVLFFSARQPRNWPVAQHIAYNPYKYDSFVLTETETPIYKATEVYLDHTGTGWVNA